MYFVLVPGTCIGVTRWPIRDYNHRTTGDMWLYRAYSGNVYHSGEQSTMLPSFTQGKRIIFNIILLLCLQ